MSLAGTVPFLIPGAVIAALLALAAGRAIGQGFRIGRGAAMVMLFSTGLILAGTLTPQWQALAYGAKGTGTCDLSRIGPPSFDDLVGGSDVAGNILMFIPLGATIALVPRSRRKAVLVVGAVALPFAIETVQLLAPALDRACESADVVDNLIGLAGGLAAGSALGRFLPQANRAR